MANYFCEMCSKIISQQEATDSSIAIRKLYGQGTGEDDDVLECYNHDFCSDCVKAFKTKEDFNKFVEDYNKTIYINTVKG